MQLGTPPLLWLKGLHLAPVPPVAPERASRPILNKDASFILLQTLFILPSSPVSSGGDPSIVRQRLQNDSGHPTESQQRRHVLLLLVSAPLAQSNAQRLQPGKHTQAHTHPIHGHRLTCTHTHTCANTEAHAHSHTGTHTQCTHAQCTHRHTRAHPHTCLHMHLPVHSHTRTCRHTPAHTHICTCMYTFSQIHKAMQTLMYVYMSTHAYTQAHTVHTHMHAHTHTCTTHTHRHT